MRIGYLIPEFPGQTHVFFWREVVAWRQMGVEVSMLSTRRGKPGACKHDFAEEGIRQTHYVYPPRIWDSLKALLSRPIRSLKSLGYVMSLRESPLKERLKYLGFIACAADLAAHVDSTGIEYLHGHSCGDAAHLLALCSILTGVPYSLTLHGDLPVYGRDHASKMGLATFVSTDGSHLKTQIVDKVGLEPHRVLPTCMGLDTNRFADAGLRQFERGKLHLVTVARLDVCKGHKYALAAMRQAVDQGCDIRYTIAGGGGHASEITKLVEELKLTDRVHMPGTVGEAEVLELLQQADAFVLPSIGLGEAWPISVMEAMSAGLPVVSSIIGATPEMIRTGEDGILVAQKDETALAEAFALLANDVEARRRIGRAARDKAVREFDVTVTARRLLDRIGVAIREARGGFGEVEGVARGVSEGRA